MFADNTLTPREAVRLCALGTICEKSLQYSQLAASIRHFITRLSGPSLDLMGSSIELLRYEGLIESTDGRAMEDDPILAATDAGRQAFRELMTAPLRPASDLSKLITALKFRFLHLLPGEDQANQVDLLIDTSETGLNRLLDLRDSMASEPGYMVEWLDDEIARAEQRLTWLEGLRERVDS
jgi:DNA-binding PadR family transcriptional regulator